MLDHERAEAEKQKQPLTPATREDLEKAKETFLRSHEARHKLRAQRRRIDEQFTLTQASAADAVLVVQKASKRYADVLGGVSDVSLEERASVKVELDEAKDVLQDRRNERQATLEALATMDRRLGDADKDVRSTWDYLRDVSRRYFKTTFSRRWLFSTGQEGEFHWRQGLLEDLLARLLTSADVMRDLAAIEAVCTGKTFTAIVHRGFQFSKEKTNPETQKSFFEHTQFVKGDVVAVPKNLPAAFAFEQVFLGRLQLVMG